MPALRFALAAVVLAATVVPASAAPLGVHPKNPRYLVFRGKATVLVGSGEHYGAVVNADFDQRRYLDTLAADGLNQIRVFTGSYYERQGAFGIGANTLAPGPGRAVVPWARVSTPGAADGGARFDLSRWDDRYFERLRSLVAEAGKRGIVVEVVLFSSYYGDGWPYSPFHAANNVNGVGDLPRQRANTLDNGPLLAVQEGLVRKLVRELAGADNVYFEIQNEPWADHEAPAGVVSFSVLPTDMSSPGAFWKNRVDLAGPASLAWQARIAAVLAEEGRAIGWRPLIAQNMANHRWPVSEADANVGILNFHYAWPEAVTLNAGLGRVIGFDETGFANASDEVSTPKTDAVYRKQAWEFLMAGGGVFSMLDYSFAVGHEDGRFVNHAPGGGSPALRRQLRVLKDFLHGFDVADLEPRPRMVVSAPGAFTRGIGSRRKRGVYVWGSGRTRLVLDLPEGEWRGEWIDTRTGVATAAAVQRRGKGDAVLDTPAYDQDIALRLTRSR